MTSRIGQHSSVVRLRLAQGCGQGFSSAFVLLLLVLTGTAVRAQSGDAERSGGAGGKADVTRLELQTAALNTIHELELTPAQLTILRGYSTAATDTDSDSGGEEPAPPAPRMGTEAYRSALQALRAALIEPHSSKLGEAQSKVEQLRDEQKLEPMPPLELTSNARRQAAPLLLTLSTGQVAGYIAQHADEIPDATQLLLDAMDQCRQSSLSQADYLTLRNSAARQAAVLLGGVDANRYNTAHDRITQWLDRVHAVSGDEYAAQEPQLEADLRRIVVRMDPMLELRYWTLHQLGELLSNPQLNAALNSLKAE